jgi:hypothetical protein
MEDTLRKIRQEMARRNMDRLGEMTLMAVHEHGQPYRMGMMVPSNPDIFKERRMDVPNEKPFFQANTIVRPDNLEHEPYTNTIRENFRNTANTNSSNYMVPGARSDIGGYDTNFNSEVRQLKPNTELLWSASGEIINTTDGKREPNLLNTSVGSYATVTTEDGKSFYSNTPVSTGPGMKGTTINNGLGGPIKEGFSDIPKIDIVDFPKIPKPSDKMLMRMAIPQHGRPFQR